MHMCIHEQHWKKLSFSKVHSKRSRRQQDLWKQVAKCICTDTQLLLGSSLQLQQNSTKHKWEY